MDKKFKRKIWITVLITTIISIAGCACFFDRWDQFIFNVIVLDFFLLAMANTIAGMRARNKLLRSIREHQELNKDKQNNETMDKGQHGQENI